MVPIYVLCFALAMAPNADKKTPSASTEDLPYQPFVEFLNPANSVEYSSNALDELRARIERERDQAIEESRKTEKHWKTELSAERRELSELNMRSSSDTQAVANRRAGLHVEIAARERGIREKREEQEHLIPEKYEVQLTRLWLARQWPARRVKILDRIEEGHGRDRRHGDVEDIGYRKLVKDSEKDVEIGRRAARQMAAEGWLPKELQDQEVQRYVGRLGARIAANSDLKVALYVTVLDSPDLQAVALPGGFLYITSGVIRTTRSESELAGVLSREIARMAARHATRTSGMSWIPRLFVPVTQVFAGIFTGGSFNPGAYYGIGYGAEGLSSLLDRALNGTDEEHQLEADQLGLQYAWKAGFDPRGFISFVDNIAGTKDADFLASKPPLKKRLLNLFSEIAYLPPQEDPVVDSPEFFRIRQRLSNKNFVSR